MARARLDPTLSAFSHNSYKLNDRGCGSNTVQDVVRESVEQLYQVGELLDCQVCISLQPNSAQHVDGEPIIDA